MTGPDHFITTRLISPVMRWRRQRGRTAAAQSILPVLMYHRLSDAPEPGVRGYYRLNTPPRLFREHLKIIREEGFTALNLADAWTEWTKKHDAGQPRDNKTVAITFDDGYQDFLSEGYPLLDEFGFSATVFLPTVFIGKERCSFKEHACLTWDEVRYLSGKGIEFGSHTVNHPRLWELPVDSLEKELAESKAAIENELGVAVSSFAHPFAFPLQDRAYVHRFRDALARCGYRLGVTTSLGCVRPGDDSMTLKRIPANGADDSDLFREKLMGAYDWLAVVQRMAKSLK